VIHSQPHNIFILIQKGLFCMTGQATPK